MGNVIEASERAIGSPDVEPTEPLGTPSLREGVERLSSTILDEVDLSLGTSPKPAGLLDQKDCQEAIRHDEIEYGNFKDDSFPLSDSVLPPSFDMLAEVSLISSEAIEDISECSVEIICEISSDSMAFPNSDSVLPASFDALHNFDRKSPNSQDNSTVSLPNLNEDIFTSSMKIAPVSQTDDSFTLSDSVLLSSSNILTEASPISSDNSAIFHTPENSVDGVVEERQVFYDTNISEDDGTPENDSKRVENLSKNTTTGNISCERERERHDRISSILRDLSKTSQNILEMSFSDLFNEAGYAASLAETEREIPRAENRTPVHSDSINGLPIQSMSSVLPQHTEENPNWALAPIDPPKPKISAEIRPRRQKRARRTDGQTVAKIAASSNNNFPPISTDGQATGRYKTSSSFSENATGPQNIFSDNSIPPPRSKLLKKWDSVQSGTSVPSSRKGEYHLNRLVDQNKAVIIPKIEKPCRSFEISNLKESSIGISGRKTKEIPIVGKANIASNVNPEGETLIQERSSFQFSSISVKSIPQNLPWPSLEEELRFHANARPLLLHVETTAKPAFPENGAEDSCLESKCFMTVSKTNHSMFDGPPANGQATAKVNLPSKLFPHPDNDLERLPVFPATRLPSNISNPTEEEFSLSRIPLRRSSLQTTPKNLHNSIFLPKSGEDEKL